LPLATGVHVKKRITRWAIMPARNNQIVAHAKFSYDAPQIAHHPWLETYNQQIRQSRIVIHGNTIEIVEVAHQPHAIRSVGTNKCAAI
jgi:hypothetical protein